MGYPLIDVLRTGQRLKEACIKKNIEAKEIKQFLGLAAMQSIRARHCHRWTIFMR